MFGWFNSKPKFEHTWTLKKHWVPTFGLCSRGLIVGEENELGERRLRVVQKCMYIDDMTFTTEQGIEALKWENGLD